MREIYRLLRLRGEPWWLALVAAPVASMCGLGPWSRYTLMQQRLDRLSDDEDKDTT